MFKDLGFELTAEGIESEEMANLLTKMNCDYLQGFYYSKPKNADNFLSFLQKAKNEYTVLSSAVKISFSSILSTGISSNSRSG